MLQLRSFSQGQENKHSEGLIDQPRQGCCLNDKTLSCRLKTPVLSSLEIKIENKFGVVWTFDEKKNGAARPGGNEDHSTDD